MSSIFISFPPLPLTPPAPPMPPTQIYDLFFLMDVSLCVCMSEREKNRENIYSAAQPIEYL